jgi:hypothetical protein
MKRCVSQIAVIITAIMLVGIISIVGALARDDGRYADSTLRDWFNGLVSGNGLCCSSADGVTITDPDIDTQDGTYLVRVCAMFQEKREDWATCKDKAWIKVPPDALVREHNKFGQAVVWPYPNGKGETRIRCFLPGGGV